MKYMLNLILCMILFVPVVSAETYLLVDEESKEIKSLSKRDDAQLEEGQEKIILDLDVNDIELFEHPRYYKYKNKRFVLNVKKMSDEENVIIELEEKQAELGLIMKRVRKNAKTELEAEGIKFEYLHE